MSNGSGSNLTCRRMSGASSGWMIAASLAASCTCRRAWSAIGLLFGDGRRSGGGRPSRGLSRQTAPYEFAHLCAWTCQNSSQSCRRKTSRRHHPNPAEAHRRWRGRGASRSGSVSVITTHAPFALKVQRQVSNGVAGLAAAGSSLDRQKARPSRAQRCKLDDQRPRRTLAEDPGSTRPELRIPGTAAQTRTVSVARIRLDPANLCDLSKG